MQETNKPLYIVVGKSASGKDYLVDKACEVFGMKKIKTYTTRESRGPEEDTHVFVDDCWFEANREDLIAYLNYAGNQYGVTENLLDTGDFLIVDPIGAESVIKTTYRDCVVILVNEDMANRVKRLQLRSVKSSPMGIYSEWDVLERLIADMATFGQDDCFCKRGFPGAITYSLTDPSLCQFMPTEYYSDFEQWLSLHSIKL